jgi:hypothetical protein
MNILTLISIYSNTCMYIGTLFRRNIESGGKRTAEEKADMTVCVCECVEKYIYLYKSPYVNVFIYTYL